MELRVLKYFLMVAREENITKAASLLHITQPTLSRQLMQLEEELGVKLFHRGKYNVTLTEDGMLLKRRAQELVELSDKTIQELSHKEDTLAGEIAIGCGETRNMSALAAQTQANITEMIDSADDDSVISELTEDGQIKAADVSKKIEDILKELTSPEIKALEDMLSEWSKISKKPLYTEYVEKHPLCKGALNNNGATSKKAISDKIEELRAALSIPEEYADDYAQLTKVQEMMDRVDNYSKTVKALRKALDDKCRKHYEKLSDEEIIDLLVNKKWVNTIANGINELYTAIPHYLAERILVLVERYERTMPDLLKDVGDYEAKVKSHLERMGFTW